MTLDEAPDLLTVDEAAAVLRIGRRQAYEAVHDGSIPSLRIGARTIRVPKARLAALLNPPDGETPAVDALAAPVSESAGQRRGSDLERTDDGNGVPHGG